MSKIVLDGDLVLKTVEEMKAQLFLASEDLNVSEIEFRNMTRWDVSGIQLLYAFQKYCNVHKKTIVFSFENADYSEHCQEMLDLLNIHK
jgi:ABC-type transporter Mla MlaB component